MLCEVAESTNFFVSWAVMTAIAFVMTMLMSAVLFYRFYWRPTFEQWQYKTNPKFPPPEMVRREVLQMMKGMATATVPPALALYLVNHGWSQAYCGASTSTAWGELGWGYLIGSFFVVVIFSDFIEFAYHRWGHKSKWGWTQHKAHHVFHNPSPFSVIADDMFDQFMRATPMLIIPLVMPVNMDMLFFTYGAFFYAYGVYLHWGFESKYISAHHPILNTAYQHNLHHKKSTLRKPYHTGFFFKIWDQLFGSMWDKECTCCRCEVAAGKRTQEEWERIEKHDYSILLKPSFWWSGKRSRKQAAPAS